MTHRPPCFPGIDFLEKYQSSNDHILATGHQINFWFGCKVWFSRSAD